MTKTRREEADGETTTIVELPGQPQDPYGYWGTIVIQGISSGSWAILLALVVLWITFRKSFLDYLSAHISLMRTLTGRLEDIKDYNSKELAHLEKQEVLLEDVQDRVKVIEREVSRSPKDS